VVEQEGKQWEMDEEEHEWGKGGGGGKGVEGWAQTVGLGVYPLAARLNHS